MSERANASSVLAILILNQIINEATEEWSIVKPRPINIYMTATPATGVLIDPITSQHQSPGPPHTAATAAYPAVVVVVC